MFHTVMSECFLLLDLSVLWAKYFAILEYTAVARWGVTAGDALSVCVYIFYTACGDQVKCSSLFHEREG